MLVCLYLWSDHTCPFLRLQLESKSDQAVCSSQSHAHELAKLQVALDNTAAELALVRRQLASAEEDRTAAAKRSSALLAQWEERDRGQGQEITTLRCAGRGRGVPELPCVGKRCMCCCH
jgi:hypothetical protein